jgi:hypothetical protein
MEASATVEAPTTGAATTPTRASERVSRRSQRQHGGNCDDPTSDD